MRVHLRSAGMDHWGVCDRVMFIGQHEECESKPSSSIPKEEETIKTEHIFMPKFNKRKRLSLDRLREIKAALCGSPSSNKPKKEKKNERWSDERYKLAEQSMWEVLKKEGATFESPIPRPALRTAARKHIGNTGLLDHLLKHIDGKVAPQGNERFRRWINPNGIMEYWLESANLDKVHQEAGQVRYWTPPSALRAGNIASQNSVSTGELRMLQAEMAQMKKDMQELKKQDKSEMFFMEETQNGFIKWKAAIEQRLAEIMTSFKGVQGMHDIVVWKTKIEQQLVEITNKLNHVQASTENIISPPLVRWEDWLESNKLDSIQENEIAPWFGNPEVLNIPQEVVLQYPNLPTQPHCEEQTYMKSTCHFPPHDYNGLLELASKMVNEDQPTVTPESSMSVNSKSDLDNSLIFIQEMLMELFSWRDKMELQLLEISNTVYEILAGKDSI